MIEYGYYKQVFEVIERSSFVLNINIKSNYVIEGNTWRDKTITNGTKLKIFFQ